MTNISLDTFRKIKKGDIVEVHTTFHHYEFIAAGKPSPILGILKGTKTKIYDNYAYDSVGDKVRRNTATGIVSVRFAFKNYSIYQSYFADPSS